jgi:hypothetical protein
MFPASHYLVLAVSASADDGTRPSSAHYGPKVELVAYTEGPTTGLNRRYPYDPLDKVGGTSAATAVVSGIAALIRSRYPTSNAAAVRNRLTSSAGPICGMPPAWMPLVNAVAAVGGICFDRRVLGPSSVNNFYAWAGTTVALSAQASGGASPLRYEWSNGTIGPQTSAYMRRGSYDTTFTVTVVDQATNAYVTSEVHHITSRMEPYTARIDGPSEVPPWSYGCLWTSATTLPSPAVYQWTVDSAPVGDGSEFLRYAPGGSSFTIGLSITDSDGTVVYASRYVSTSTYAAACQDS